MRRLSLLLVAFAFSSTAKAQLTLPGATESAPVGTVATPAPAPKPKPHAPRVVPLATPADSSLASKTLSLNGGKSQIAFVARDKTVDISRLLLTGTKMSKPQDECQVDVSGMPLVPTPAGKVEGLTRFAIPLPACPISFDVLNGAILTSSETPNCDFKKADCRTPVVGLWGPAAGDIGPDQVKGLERERTQAENAVRTAYKGLVSSTKDRSVLKAFAGDQAGFSSHREETCRDYIGESRHGFCGSRLTLARGVTLDAELVVAQAAKDARKRKKENRTKK